MTRLRTRLESCRDDGRAAVVGYLPAGFPDRTGYRTLVERAFTAGLDALEIGLPGPTPATEGVTHHRGPEQRSRRSQRATGCAHPRRRCPRTR